MAEQPYLPTGGMEPQTNKAIENALAIYREACSESRAAASRKRSTHDALIMVMGAEGVEVYSYRDALGKKKTLRAESTKKAKIATVKEPRVPKRRGKRGSSWAESSTAASSHAGAPNGKSAAKVDQRLVDAAEASAKKSKRKPAKKSKR